MSVFVAIFGLGLLILIHEAGHFFAALAVGMRPRSFNLGFGPPLAKITRKGIDYALRPIPLGGYVKIPGMHRPGPSDTDAYFGRALRDVPQLVGPVERAKRALADEDAERARSQLAEIESIAAQYEATHGVERGVRELNDALGPDAYWRQPTWKRILVIFAGPGTNALLAVFLFWLVFLVSGGKVTTTVGEGFSGRPAQALGLHPGDRILAVEGKRVGPLDISRRISSSEGRPITVTVERDGRIVVLGPVRARPDEGVYRLGFRLRAQGLGAGEAGWESLRLTGVVTRETVKSLGRIVHKEGRKDLASPVGIVKESSNAARAGVEQYLAVLGFISLSLALLNLLPLLPLDGGHIAFSLIEKLRGRAIPREAYERVSAIGIALVLLLFVLGVSNDINRLNGG